MHSVCYTQDDVLFGYAKVEPSNISNLNSISDRIFKVLLALVFYVDKILVMGPESWLTRPDPGQIKIDSKCSAKKKKTSFDAKYHYHCCGHQNLRLSLQFYTKSKRQFS